MKSLPSLKDKKRYLVFELISKERKGLNAKEAVTKAVHEFAGTMGSAKSKIRFLNDKWNNEKQRGILCADRKSTDMVKGALCLAKKAGESKAIIRTLGTSGILKKAIEKYY